MKTTKTITAYRKKSSGAGQIGAGTFYFLNIPSSLEQKVNTFQFSFKREEILDIFHQRVKPFEGLPSEFLAEKWFPELDWEQKADELGFDETGAAMDILVAEEAKNRGWKAIKYGKIELQVL